MKSTLVKRTISFSLTLVLVTNLGFISLSPQKANASIKSNVASFTGCYAGGVLTPYLSTKINDGLDKLQAKATEYLDGVLSKIFHVYISRNNPLGRAASSAIGMTVPVSDSGTQKALSNVKEAINKDTAVFTTIEYRNVIIARCLARQIMIAMNKNALQVVRTGGRDGGVTFIKNWTNFQTNAQYRGENIFRAELSTAHLCDYLANDIKKSFGVDPGTKTPITGQNTRADSLRPFSLSSKCTLPSGFSMENYQKDFAGNGGWNTWMRILEPQNNVYGLTALSLDEIQKQRSLAVSADVNQAIANNGYLGISGNGKSNSCLVKAKTGECIVYGDIKTPGSYLAANVQASVMSEFEWLTSAQGLNTIISTATEVLLNRLLDFGNSDEGNYRQSNDGDRETPQLTLPTDPTNPDGSGVCSGSETGSSDYAGALRSAMNAVISSNPNGIADALNTADNSFTFLELVATQLKNSGFNATTGVKNGHDSANQGDLIALWRTGDATVERYDAISDSGAGNAPLRSSLVTDYTGDILPSCTSESSGGSCINSEALTILSAPNAKNILNSITLENKVRRPEDIQEQLRLLVGPFNSITTAARNKIKNDTSQLSNDQLLAQISSDFTSLINFINGEQNDGNLSAKNQLDTMRSQIITQLDSLTSQSACSTNSGGGSGGGDNTNQQSF